MNIEEFLQSVVDQAENYFNCKVMHNKHDFISSNLEAKTFCQDLTPEKLHIKSLCCCPSLISIFTNTNIQTVFQHNFRIILTIKTNFIYICGSKELTNTAYDFLNKYKDWDTNMPYRYFNQTIFRNKLKKRNICIFKYISNKSKLLLYEMLIDIFEINVIVNDSFEQNDDIQEIIVIHSEDEEDDDIKIIDVIPQNTCIVSNNTLRPIVIDGANVSYSTHNKQFNGRRIKIVVDFFRDRGHKNIYVLIPRHYQHEGGEIFNNLVNEGVLFYTPSRLIDNVRETSYDDKLILESAYGYNGVVVSNDQYRDLYHIEKYQEIIKNRLIQYVFVGDLFMVPDDPRGLKGPNLEAILSFNLNQSAPKIKLERKKLKKLNYKKNVNKDNKSKLKLLKGYKKSLKKKKNK